MRTLLAAIVLTLSIIAGPVHGQTVEPRLLTKRDVLLDKTRQLIFACNAEPTSKFEYSFRLTNNSIWTLQFPAFQGGTAHVARKLATGREVGMLANESIFFPGYGLIENGRIERTINIHSGTSSFLPPGFSATFSIPRKVVSPSARLYLDFNFEWELDTVYLSNPIHRFYIDFQRHLPKISGC
jgi:hypothetical protein